MEVQSDKLEKLLTLDMELNRLENIHICFCSDKNLIDFIPVVINSILNKNSKIKIIIHYINNIENETKIEYLRKYIESYNNLSFVTYKKNWNRKYKGIKHVSVATMLRLFIPELIKTKRVLYLDIDIIVNTNLTQLYNTYCGKTGIAMKNSIVYSEFGKYSNKKSGNCGIIVMDLETLRKNNFTKKCLDIHSNNQNKHDQFIINMYCNGNHMVLEPRFNIFLNQDDYLINKESDFILHYAGGKKPYYHNTGKYQYLWDIYNTAKYQYLEKQKCVLLLNTNIKINLGILIYNNEYNKYATSNIGDYIQSLSAINIYRKIVQKFNNIEYDFEKFLGLVIKNEVPNFNIIFIKRDNMYDITQYQKFTNIITIMNGWWMHPYNDKKNISFKIPHNIIPVFTSFHIANEKLLTPIYLNEFKKYQPIGCRDLKTTNKLIKNGIDAYFSGCLTTTIDFYKWKNESNIIFNVDTLVKNKGIYFKHVNPKWKNVDFRIGLHDALYILKIYSKCKYVNTSRLHCYLPCLAMKIPVNFISPDGDTKKKTWGSKDRFDGLRELQNDITKFNEIRNNLENTVLCKINKLINN